MFPGIEGRMTVALVTGVLAAAGYLLTAGQPAGPDTHPAPNASDRCHTAGCSGQLCVPTGENPTTTCEWRPEYGCLKDCRPRDGTCSFDPNFRRSCLDCLERCRSQGRGSDCFRQCHAQ